MVLRMSLSEVLVVAFSSLSAGMQIISAVDALGEGHSPVLHIVAAVCSLGAAILAVGAAAVRVSSSAP